MTVEDCIIIGGSQLRWYLPSVAPRTSTVWYGVIFLSETRRLSRNDCLSICCSHKHRCTQTKTQMQIYLEKHKHKRLPHVKCVAPAKRRLEDARSRLPSSDCLAFAQPVLTSFHYHQQHFRSVISHPDLLVTQQHHPPTFSDHIGPQHWTFTF